MTTVLIDKLELDITRQRLDSTHVFSHMANFGRTKLMAVAIKRFLTQVNRHAPESYAALPEPFRRRYEPAESHCSPRKEPRLGSGRGSRPPRTCSLPSNALPTVPI